MYNIKILITKNKPFNLKTPKFIYEIWILNVLQDNLKFRNQIRAYYYQKFKLEATIINIFYLDIIALKYLYGIKIGMKK